MSQPDYDALASQHGGTPVVDYDALAQQHGGSAVDEDGLDENRAAVEREVGAGEMASPGRRFVEGMAAGAGIPTSKAQAMEMARTQYGPRDLVETIAGAHPLTKAWLDTATHGAAAIEAARAGAAPLDVGAEVAAAGASALPGVGGLVADIAGKLGRGDLAGAGGVVLGTVATAKAAKHAPEIAAGAGKAAGATARTMAGAAESGAAHGASAVGAAHLAHMMGLPWEVGAMAGPALLKTGGAVLARVAHLLSREAPEVVAAAARPAAPAEAPARPASAPAAPQAPAVDPAPARPAAAEPAPQASPPQRVVRPIPPGKWEAPIKPPAPRPGNPQIVRAMAAGAPPDVIGQMAQAIERGETIPDYAPPGKAEPPAPATPAAPAADPDMTVPGGWRRVGISNWYGTEGGPSVADWNKMGGARAQRAWLESRNLIPGGATPQDVAAAVARGVPPEQVRKLYGEPRMPAAGKPRKPTASRRGPAGLDANAKPALSSREMLPERGPGNSATNPQADPGGGLNRSVTVASDVRPDAHVDARTVLPPHEVKEPQKADALVRAMSADGWRGRPLLAIDDGDSLQALTGSHRIAAARQAGIDIPVVSVPKAAIARAAELAERFYQGDHEGYPRFEWMDDSEKAQFFREGVEKTDDTDLWRALKLVEAEEEANRIDDTSGPKSDAPPARGASDLHAAITAPSAARGAEPTPQAFLSTYRASVREMQDALRAGVIPESQRAQVEALAGKTDAQVLSAHLAMKVNSLAKQGLSRAQITAALRDTHGLPRGTAAQAVAMILGQEAHP